MVTLPRSFGVCGIVDGIFSIFEEATETAAWFILPFSNQFENDASIHMPIIRGHFLVALHRIRCEGRLQNGIKLSDGLRLIDDHSRIPAFKDHDFRESVGHMEMASMMKAKLFAVSDEIEFDLPDGTNGPGLVVYLLNVVRTYLFTLWMIKDNSAYFG